MWKRKKGEKYGRKRIEAIPGHWFDSKLEAAVFSLLSLRQRGGEIADLAHHGFTVYLTDAEIGFRPDFRFTVCATGETAYAEAKGFETRDYDIKKRLWKFYGPGRLEIWKGTAKNPRLVETIIPKVAA